LYSCQGEKLNLENTTLLENFRLTGIYPNPFNPEVKIEFETMISSQIKVAIYNVKGQEISLLENHFLPSGRHVTSWNAKGNNSGIYFLRISSEHHTISVKLIFLQ
ncbi:MAG: T9SS type A sorting domain-containing protein, partial [Candidatus Marinimicrobia bacterium]|nr:T9SS type A sorting domain-containing protein [Candidatus Neomarinimicrobiota bacterium]